MDCCLFTLLLILPLSAALSRTPHSDDVSKLEARSAEVNRLDALEVLLQTQAGTIQDLQARQNNLDITNQHLKDLLGQQNVTIQLQGAIILSLQSRLDTEDGTHQNLLADLHRQTAIIQDLQQLAQAQNRTNLDLETRLIHQEQVDQQQDQSLQKYNQTQYQQAATIHSLQAQPQGMPVGFQADFGSSPYHGVTLTKGSPVVWSRVLTNVGQGFNSSSGVFHVPVDGLYAFHLHFMGRSTHSNTTELGIFTDGDSSALAIALAQGGQADEDDQGSCTAVTHLNRGQRVSVQLVYGQPDIWGSRLTSFSGMLVQAD